MAETKIKPEQALPATRSKVGTFGHDVSTASGDVAVTGVGFKPSSLILIYIGASGTTDKIGIGVADSDGTEKTIFEQTGPGYYFSASWLVNLFNYGGAGNYSNAVLKSYDSDGFTLTFTKTGSPTGTAYFVYLAFR